MLLFLFFHSIFCKINYNNFTGTTVADTACVFTSACAKNFRFLQATIYEEHHGVPQNDGVFGMGLQDTISPYLVKPVWFLESFQIYSLSQFKLCL